MGTDVPELGKLLQSNPNTVHSEEVERALVVTRAQARRDEKEERERVMRDEQSGSVPNTLEEDQQETPGAPIEGVEVEEEPMGVGPGSSFAEDLFEGGTSTREVLTHSQKRKQRREHGLVRAKDKPQKDDRADPVLGITSRELQRLQEGDEGLSRARELARGGGRRLFLEGWTTLQEVGVAEGG